MGYIDGGGGYLLLLAWCETSNLEPLDGLAGSRGDGFVRAQL